jgi:hypothetical protein
MTDQNPVDGSAVVTRPPRFWVIKQDQLDLTGMSITYKKRDARRLVRKLTKADPEGRYGIWKFLDG